MNKDGMPIAIKQNKVQNKIFPLSVVLPDLPMTKIINENNTKKNKNFTNIGVHYIEILLIFLFIVHFMFAKTMLEFYCTQI